MPPARAAESGLELWGGHECTVNRVGDAYRDQTRLSGHHDRPGDLELFASLGLRRLRYPVLWERVAPDRPDEHDWRWSDDRLARVRRLGMEPIVGLVHHGSGPRYTSLVDDAFPALLGRYAGAAAARYPDVTGWTPVNEPLTTARFSALYGHWYPHARDERLFWTALLNQVDGTRAAMRAIRAVNSVARLIQTEDLGRCHATEAASGVAAFYNHRRWMTWDLLAGRVTPGHALWEKLAGLGLGDRLRAAADDPCPPDVVGVNHYVTSDRFLDDRAGAHAASLLPEGYHDVAAIRVLDPPPQGLSGALREAWERYRVPVAVTECHLGCTREEQLRWVDRAWRECLRLRADGVDVRALTAWALLGSYDWNSLLTRRSGHYEPGAFDLRGGTPRPTAIAALLAGLGGAGDLPAGVAIAVGGPGWWERDSRLEHPPHDAGGVRRVAPPAGEVAPVLIIGGAGGLASAFARACRVRGIAHALARDAEPSRGGSGAAAVLDRHRPWAVIHAAGNAADVGRGCPGDLARLCAERNIRLVLFASGDSGVGGGGAGYGPAAPGIADAGATLVMYAGPSSPDDPHGAEGDAVAATDASDLARACLDLVIDGATGPWRLTGGEAARCPTFDRRAAAPGPGAPAPASAGSRPA